MVASRLAGPSPLGSLGSYFHVWFAFEEGNDA